MKPLIFVFLIVLSSSAFAANSLIRVDCMEDSAGAEVSLNGQYQFTCSDYQKKLIALKPGDYTLKAVKKLSKTYQQVFTQKLSLVSGTPDRVKVVLPAKTPTAYGKVALKQKQEKAKAAAKAAAEAEAKRQQELAVAKDIADAKAGETDAMKRLAERYKTGNGVPEDADKSRQWQNRSTIATLKRKKQSSSLLPLVSSAFQQGSNGNSNPSDMTVLTMASPVFLLSDLISMPSVTSRRSEIQGRIDELETHASRWANPHSMVARAYNAEQ